MTAHRWYPRPVLFVTDLDRALRFYLDGLGFTKKWHEGDGAGGVCQVDRGECEIILCRDPARTDRGRLYVELTPEGLAEVRRELEARSITTTERWWGHPTVVVPDPDGNELFFPIPDTDRTLS